MTHDERLDKIRWAILTAKCVCDHRPFGGPCRRCEAKAAFEAAGIEDMVREAANAGWIAGFGWVKYDKALDARPIQVDGIVREVMGK